MGLMIEAFVYAVLMIAGGFIWGQQHEANKTRRAMQTTRRKIRVEKW